jgi:excisionase family DNA binding protein
MIQPCKTESARITPGEVAEMLSVSRPTAYNMLRSGTIPCIRQGRLFIIGRQAFARWLANCGQTAVQ